MSVWKTTLKIIERIEARVAKDKYLGTSELNSLLREETVALLNEHDYSNSNVEERINSKKPYVIMVVGCERSG